MGPDFSLGRQKKLGLHVPLPFYASKRGVSGFRGDRSCDAGYSAELEMQGEGLLLGRNELKWTQSDVFPVWSFLVQLSAGLRAEIERSGSRCEASASCLGFVAGR